MKLWTTLLAAAATGFTSASAFAVPISGAYTMTVARVTADTVDLSQASTIYFSGDALTRPNVISSFSPNAGFTPSSATACLNCGTINNITGIPAGSATTPFAAISPLFTVQGLSFTLSSLTQVVRTSMTEGSSLILKGDGFYSAAGYDDTPGTYNITVQNGSMMVQADSVSASGNAQAAANTVQLAASVPEPVSLALLGAALATLGLVRRLKRG